MQSRVKMLEKLELLEVDEEDTSALRLKFPPSPRSGSYPVIMDGVGKTYGDHVVFKNATLTIERYGKTFRLPIVFDSKDDAVQNEEPTTSANALEPSEQDSPRP